MSTLSFLPLGLPNDHEFWTNPEQEWISKKHGIIVILKKVIT